MLFRHVLILTFVSGFGFADTITTITVPGATATYANGINDAGAIVGYFTDASGHTHSFLDNNGNITQIDYGSNGYTAAVGINDAGVIVGATRSVVGNPTYGFVDTNGSFQLISDPPYFSAEVTGINDAGQFVGYGVTGSYAGFLDSGGTLSPIQYGGANTTAFGINDSGEIVGAYFSGGIYQGFVDNGGNLSTLDVPGATLTELLGVNNAGQISGVYEDAGGNYHGFVDNGGMFTTIDVPGATATTAFGINNNGQIVGDYTDASGVVHGFLDTPSSSAPEPSTTLLAVSAVMLLVLTARSKARA